MPSPSVTAPAANLTSGQFINVEKLHIAKMLTDVPNGTATYEPPISLGKILRKVDIKPKTSQAELFADGQSVDTAANTASYDLTFDTSALPLEYIAYLFGHKIDKGVMTANKDDVPPYFAVMFHSDKRNGKKRFMKFFKDEFSQGYAINTILSAGNLIKAIFDIEEANYTLTEEQITIAWFHGTLTLEAYRAKSHPK